MKFNLERVHRICYRAALVLYSKPFKTKENHPFLNIKSHNKLKEKNQPNHLNHFHNRKFQHFLNFLKKTEKKGFTKIHNKKLTKAV